MIPKESPKTLIVSAVEAKPIIDKIYHIDLVVDANDFIEFGGMKNLINARINAGNRTIVPLLELVSFIRENRPDLYWVWAASDSHVGKVVQRVLNKNIYEHTFRHPGKKD